ncbi:hypothetical protein D046_0689A, partial [Vibrio parahaemolyticus V-223/04]
MPTIQPDHTLDQSTSPSCS